MTPKLEANNELAHYNKELEKLLICSLLTRQTNLQGQFLLSDIHGY